MERIRQLRIVFIYTYMHLYSYKLHNAGLLMEMYCDSLHKKTIVLYVIEKTKQNLIRKKSSELMPYLASIENVQIKMNRSESSVFSFLPKYSFW